jgi:hypothetical protein
MNLVSRCELHSIANERSGDYSMSGYLERREFDMSVSTALSVSVTRSTAIVMVKLGAKLVFP